MTKDRKHKKFTSRETIINSLTAYRIQLLRQAAEQLGAIIPGTSPNKNGFCFRYLASKQTLLKRYWKSEATKKESIYEFLRQAYQYHPSVLKKLIREALSRGIERRLQRGEPILLVEIQALAKTLNALNIDLSKEIKQLNLPVNRPSIVPPRIELQKALELIELHPILMPDCLKLFKNGHINEAARKALEKYEAVVRSKTGLQAIGADVMAKAFDESNPKINISIDKDERRRRALQGGFKLLSMGAMEFWRNYLSHDDEKQIPAQSSMTIIAVVSHFFFLLEETLT